MTPEDILANLQLAFPSSESALSCFRSDLKNSDALSLLARKAAVLAGR